VVAVASGTSLPAVPGPVAALGLSRNLPEATVQQMKEEAEQDLWPRQTSLTSLSIRLPVVKSDGSGSEAL